MRFVKQDLPRETIAGNHYQEMIKIIYMVHKPSFFGFLKLFQPWKALLSLPMQRLPRYILLLQELRKQTEKFNPGHDDLGNLQMAIKGIKDVTATVSTFRVLF